MPAQLTPPPGAHPDDSRRPRPDDPVHRTPSAQDVATAEVLIDQLRGGWDSQPPPAHEIPRPSPSPADAYHRAGPLKEDRMPASEYTLPPIAAASSSSYGPIAPRSPPATSSTGPRNSPMLQNPSTPGEPSSAKSSSSASSGQVCSNCGTTRTPLWRRSASGQTICNACGLYQKARNANRPPNLKRPPSYAPAFPKQSEQSQPANGQHLPNGAVYYAPDQPTQGSCPGDGKCNGTGGTAACDGCPAFNNRVAKAAQLGQQQQQHRAARPGTPSSVEPGHQSESASGGTENVVIACQNCHTTTTPLWRRDLDGHTICNACGLYFKLHGHHRPVEMKKSYIKRRKRVAPALGEHATQRSGTSTTPNPQHSTSPEAAPSAYPPVSAPSRVDPNLYQSHGPVPVDFTSYGRHAPPHEPITSRMPTYDPLHDPSTTAPSMPSPKRQRYSPVHSAAEDAAATGAGSRALPIHSHRSPPARPDTVPDGPPPSQNEHEEKRRKRMKREILRQQIAEMQKQVNDLGESDDD